MESIIGKEEYEKLKLNERDMGKHMKCDKCEKIFIAWTKRTVNLSSRSREKILKKDLCPSCANKLIRFLNTIIN